MSIGKATTRPRRVVLPPDEAWIRGQLLHKNLAKVKPGPDGYSWITGEQAFEFSALPVQKKPNVSQAMGAVLKALSDNAAGFEGVQWVTGRPILKHPKTGVEYQPIRHMWRLGRDADRVLYLHNLVRQLGAKITAEVQLVQDPELRQKLSSFQQATEAILHDLQQQIQPIPTELKPRLRRPGEMNDPDRSV